MFVTEKRLLSVRAYAGRLAPILCGVEATDLVLEGNSRVWWPDTRRCNRVVRVKGS